LRLYGLETRAAINFFRERQFAMLLIENIDQDTFFRLLGRYGLETELRPPASLLPGSYWGEPEAGLVGNRLYVRPDTPVHSALHEGCHFICMDSERRKSLHTDAGGEFIEENGVCYLQALLADHLPDMGRERMFRDMDEWGYSFRLGSARAWFEQDAQDAREWLQDNGLIDSELRPTWRVRD
jgi:hypothetical protein